MPNLFVEPEHGAGHRDVSKTDPLPHQEGASVQMLVQHCKGSLYILLSLLCSLESEREKINSNHEYTILHILFYIMKYIRCYTQVLAN